jgi:hypothetical protein
MKSLSLDFSTDITMDCKDYPYLVSASLWTQTLQSQPLMYCNLAFQLQSPLSMTGNMAAVALPKQSQVTPGGLRGTVIGWGYLFVSARLFYWRTNKPFAT